METIFAVSSGAPPAAIAVLRVSGARALTACRAMCGALPESRQAGLRALRDPTSGGLLDRALVLVFPGPRSATGEDLVELHLHGGRAVVASVEAVLAAQPGLRRALPGEFTRRAMIAGRIDLAEAEGLGDLLLAETEAQRRAALGSAEGAVSRAIGGWSRRLLMLSARIEAILDFSDEGDVADDAPDVLRGLGELADDMAVVITNPPVERLRDGIRIVLAGPPNSGKSTLLNALAERDAAIVSPIAGTTRDRIDVPVVRDGIAYLLTDTAGLATASDDPIERIGITRARDAIALADIVLWLGDDPPELSAIWLHARADLPGRGGALPAGRDLAVSVETGVGLGSLWRAIAARADALLPRLDRLVLNQRQRSLCEAAQASLADAVHQSDLLVVAEHCRLARRALDAVTGVTGIEDMLDMLFGRFCIGK